MLVENNIGESNNSTMLRMNWMMSSSKVAWADLNAIKRIMQIIKEHMKKVNCPNYIIILYG